MASPERRAATERAEKDLHALTLRHAELRSQLEAHHAHIQEIEERFLALRPGPRADDQTRAELRKRMVLARPWREELNTTYQGMLQNIHELDLIIRRIREVQAFIAQNVGPG